MIKKILTTFFVALSVISCGALQSTESNPPSANGGYELGSNKRIIGKVFQTINNHQALVEASSINNKTYSSGDQPLVYIVTPSTCREYFFDELSIGGFYIFIGTHQYKTVNRNYDQFKTVPVFIHRDYYIKGMEWNDRLNRIDTPEASEI